MLKKQKRELLKNKLIHVILKNTEDDQIKDIPEILRQFSKDLEKDIKKRK